jgi:hypothetical protein
MAARSNRRAARRHQVNGRLPDRLREEAAMSRQAPLAVFLFGCALLCGRAGQAEDIVTDANIVTGLDISYSIDRSDTSREIAGMAQAIRSPEVLSAIRGGRHGRIGFAVFAWHHNQFPVVASWTLIASEDDALAAAREIEARLLVDVEMEARNKEAFYIGRLTNLSQAIDHATEMLRTAPFATDRSVINIIGNGEDNVGEDAGIARDRVVDMGGIVNGVVLSEDPAVLDYYRQEVMGGPGAFVLSTGDAASLVEVLRRKLLNDLVVAAAP